MVDKDADISRTICSGVEERGRRFAVESRGELIFSGYSDPRKCAEQHFKAQFQEFVAAHADMGGSTISANRRSPSHTDRMGADVSAASLKV